VALFAAAGLCVAGGASAQTQTMSKEARDTAIKHAEAQYKLDKATCDALSGNAKDVCMEEAKGKEKVAKAEADAAFESTSKARETARTAARRCVRVARKNATTSLVIRRMSVSRKLRRRM
jgi:hypothetical protein